MNSLNDTIEMSLIVTFLGHRFDLQLLPVLLHFAGKHNLTDIYLLSFYHLAVYQPFASS